MYQIIPLSLTKKKTIKTKRLSSVKVKASIDTSSKFTGTIQKIVKFITSLG